MSPNNFVMVLSPQTSVYSNTMSPNNFVMVLSPQTSVCNDTMSQTTSYMVLCPQTCVCDNTMSPNNFVHGIMSSNVSVKSASFPRVLLDKRFMFRGCINEVVIQTNIYVQLLNLLHLWLASCSLKLNCLNIKFKTVCVSLPQRGNMRWPVSTARNLQRNRYCSAWIKHVAILDIITFVNFCLSAL